MVLTIGDEEAFAACYGVNLAALPAETGRSDLGARGLKVVL
jgi:hypothetical protein